MRRGKLGVVDEAPRVLVAARKSRLIKGQDSVSIERQDDNRVKYAAEIGDSAPIIARDAGVSGSVSPFKRPDLGPYLTDTPPETWTELVAAAIDRLGRNARDLAELRSWCEDHGKRITILSPRLHWPPDETDVTSRIVWVVLEMLAEIELRQTKKRYADTREFLRDQKSLMGKACWGFMIVGPKAQKTLAPDPSRVRHLLGMIEMAEAGESMTDIAVWLDGEGVSPAGEKGCTTWDPKSVSQVLRNEALYGVRRENGQILLRHEGVISKERWDALQAKLDSSLKRRGPTRNDPMMLTDSIYCAKCSGVMHGRRLRSRSVPQQHQERDAEIYAKAKDGLTHQTLAEQYKISRQRITDIVRIYDRLADGQEVTPYEWAGYRCDGKPREPSTCRNMVPAGDIEAWVDKWFTIPAAEGGSGFADVEIMESVYIPAQGHADEIDEVEQEIKELDLDASDYDERHAELRAERARLIALGTEPAHTEDRPTGIKLGDYWPTLDTAGKRDYLTSVGVKVFAASKKSEREEREAGQVAGEMTSWIEGDPRRVLGTLARKVPVSA